MDRSDSVNNSTQSQAAEPFVVGLIGGVGSGKSSVASYVAEHMDVVAIDGDRIGHQVLMLPDVKTRLREQFGSEIFDEQSQIVRAKLGEIVFGDSAEKKLQRQALEAIVHPAIGQQIDRQISEAKQTGACGVLLDAAVLLEAGLGSVCDRIVFIDTPESHRQQRVTSQRGWTVENWRSREQSQLSLAHKRQLADCIVDNSGSVAQAGQQLLSYLEQQCGWPTDQSVRNLQPK